jgi:hypothetical protein
LIVAAIRRGTPEIFHPHARGALSAEIEGFGRALRDVDDPVCVVWPAVIDAHHDGTSVRQIGDPGVARERHRGVRGRDGIAVEDFAVGREATVEVGPVPRG